MMAEAQPRIRMFGMDVDGVLTDGGIYYGSSGLEIKRFNTQDGMGITLLRKAGIVPFIITARMSEATQRRGGELGIAEIHQGVRDKLACLEEIASRHGVVYEEIAFVGDDLADLAVLESIGYPIAVANARDEVKRVAVFVTHCSGGAGAVREASEYAIRLNGYDEESMIGLLTAAEEPEDLRA
jgi:3-deoxy-D-manno-octulosonate 8-phosphate phosphatase (KDO 8-P phosphatase)